MLEQNFDITVNTTNKHLEPIRDGILFLTIRNPYNYRASRKKMLWQQDSLEKSINEYNEFLKYIYDCIVVNYDKLKNNHIQVLDYISEQIEIGYRGIFITKKIMNKNDRFEYFENHLLTDEEYQYINDNIDWRTLYQKDVDFLN